MTNSFSAGVYLIVEFRVFDVYLARVDPNDRSYDRSLHLLYNRKVKIAHTVFLMHSFDLPHIHTASDNIVVELGQIRDGSEFGPGKFREGVEEKSVSVARDEVRKD